MSVYDDIVKQGSITKMLEYYGVERQHNGMYKCPFHNEDTASFSVTNDDKHWECFGCHKEGTIIDFVKEIEAQRGHYIEDFKEIYNFIITEQNLSIDFTLPSEGNQRLSEEDKEKNLLYSIMKEAQSLSAWRLEKDKESNGVAYKYLKKRHISDDTIKEFGLGYNPKYLLQSKLSKKFKNEDLFKAGILSKNDNDNKYYDSENNRLLVPISDAQGRTVAFGGRILSNDKKTVKYKNTKVSPIFQKKAILFNYHRAQQIAKGENEIVLVEGYFDAISAWELGLKNAVAIMGSELTNEQLIMIKSLNVPVTLCLDNDDVGRNSMCKIIPALYDEGIEVKVINARQLKAGKDMNDFLINGINKKNIEEVKVKGIDFLFDYYFSSELSNNSISADVIKSVYNKIISDDRLNDSYIDNLFQEYTCKHFNYEKNEVKGICHPHQNNSELGKAMRNCFGSYILNKLKQIAINEDNNILQKFLEQGRFNFNHILNGFEEGKYISDDGRKIDIGNYCKEYLLNTTEYKEFEKTYDGSFDKILNNVSALDKSGNSVKVKLNAHQKDLVMSQFSKSFNIEGTEALKKDNDKFAKLYIADNLDECKKFFDDGYDKRDLRYNLSRFSEGYMARINYSAQYSQEDLKRFNKNPQLKDKYLNSKGNAFQVVLIFNNTGNILDLKAENYISNEFQYDSIISNREQGIPSTNYKNPRTSRMAHNNNMGHPPDG